MGQIDLHSRDTWLAVLAVARISSDQTPLEAGLGQMIDLARRCDDELVFTADSEYGQPLSAACLDQCRHVTGVFRMRSNRKLYRRPPAYSGQGHPVWHGPLFRLNDPTTWPDPGRVSAEQPNRWARPHLNYPPAAVESPPLL
jgi:hypothetical protein